MLFYCLYDLYSIYTGPQILESNNTDSIVVENTVRFLRCVVQNRHDAPANLNIRWINQGRVVNVSEYPSLIINTTMEDNNRIVTSTLTFNPVNYKVFDPFSGYKNNFQCEAFIGNYIFDAVRNRGAVLTVNCKLIDVIEYKLVITSAYSVLDVHFGCSVYHC